MKPKLHRIDNQPAYRKWVKARDRALEDLNTRAHLETTDVLNLALGRVLEISKNYFYDMQNGGSGEQLFEHHMKRIFSDLAVSLYHIIINLRVRSYVLAKSSQCEILAQLVKQPKSPIASRIDKSHLLKIKDKSAVAGGVIHARIKMYCDRLRRKLESQAHMAAINSKDVETFLIHITHAFPKRRVVKQPKRILNPKLMEARSDDDETDDVDMSVDLIDEGAWNDMVDAYKDDYIPTTRAPEYVVDIPVADPTVQKNGDEVWYAWEFERDMTNEFVQSVRDGEIEAANDNGVTDFVWIAVLDSATDECCSWRDGLLVSEIEDQLDDHEKEDDECDTEGDGLTPPLHFNCRCTLAPALENIPDKPDDGAKEFDDWLDS